MKWKIQTVFYGRFDACIFLYDHLNLWSNESRKAIFDLIALSNVLNMER